MGLMKCDFGAFTLAENKLEKFLNQVQSTYREELTYHNDLHGADVMHMCFYFMKNTKLVQILKMSDLDKLTMIIASTCHDLGHDGFTNSYHSNAATARAISANNISIQENYHVVEMFRILSLHETNFLSELG